MIIYKTVHIHIHRLCKHKIWVRSLFALFFISKVSRQRISNVFYSTWFLCALHFFPFANSKEQWIFVSLDLGLLRVVTACLCSIVLSECNDGVNNEFENEQHLTRSRYIIRTSHTSRDLCIGVVLRFYVQWYIFGSILFFSFFPLSTFVVVVFFSLVSWSIFVFTMPRSKMIISLVNIQDLDEDKTKVNTPEKIKVKIVQHVIVSY